MLAAAGARISHLDPATLASVAVADTGVPWGFRGFGALSDGAVIAEAYADGGYTPAYRYVPREYKATSISGYDFYRPRIAASGDGSTVLMSSTFSSGAPVYRYDASAGVLAATSVPNNVWSIALDGTGSRAILRVDLYPTPEWRVYDRAFALLGTLPTATIAAVLSPDGTRAYTFEQGTNPIVRTFDATAAVAGMLPEIGSAVTLAGSPGATNDEFRMTISPDGGTLFGAGNGAVAVQPAP